jgi:hypothetical protein
VLVAGLLTAALAGVRLWRLDASCLWFDEVFSVHAARHGWGALWDFVAVDLIHPPLFYVLLKSWMTVVGSESVWWLRLFTVLTATAAAVPVVLLCRELRLRVRVGQVAVGLMAASGLLIQHARDVRMYSLLLLFAACSLWLFACYSQAAWDDRRQQRRSLAALFAVNLLLVYTHYYGWLLVGHELIFLLVWRRRKATGFVLMLAALVVCYSPWLWMLWQARAGAGAGLAQNIGWAVVPRGADFFQPYLVLHEPFRFRRNTYERVVLRINVWLTLALFVPAFVALGWRVLEQRRALARARKLETATERPRDVRRDESEALALKFLIFFSTAPVVFAFLLSHVLPHSIWATRYLIIIAPAYLLLAAYALNALRPAWLATTIKLLLACWLAVAALNWFVRRRDAPPVWCAWETLAHQAVETEASAAPASEIKIYATEDLIAYHLWYALSSGSSGDSAGSANAAGESRFRVARIANLPGLVEDRGYFLPRGFDAVTVTDASGEAGGLREEHFWAAFRDTSWNDEHPLLRLLAERGYEIDERFEVAASGQKAFIVSARRRK